MITVMLQGRIGNQMFQYAFARHLQNKYYMNEKIYLNNAYIYKLDNGEDGWKNNLDLFKVNNYYDTDCLNINFIQKAVFYLYKIIRRIYQKIHGKDSKDFELKFVKILNYFGLYCLSTGYYDFTKSKFKNKLISGSFESDKYFNDIKKDLIKEFIPVKPLNIENHTLYENICHSQSVCVSIRRGDFLSDRYKSAYYVCDEKYFYQAINKIKKEIHNARFFIFSDDIEWAKESLDLPEDTMFENGNDDVATKMFLMSSCKHFIISNSTFSWWSQYLGDYPNKYVIAPSKWSNIIHHRDMYCENWELLNIEE